MGRTLFVQIKDGKGKGSCQFQTDINLDDFKKVALFFGDLNSFGVNIDKAFFEFKRKDNRYPW